MPQAKILIDSCSYLRLARSIHPLLFREFGEQQYCLYVIEEFQEEFDRQPRLQRKFSWVTEPEYHENRSKGIQVSKDEREQVERACDYILDLADEEKLGISWVDTNAVALAYVLNIPLVTDDSDLREVCEAFEVEVLKSLELLKRMLDCQHITLEKVREISAYWQYEKDTPKDFREDYTRLFHEEPPA